MKKLLVGVTVLTLAFSLFGCAGKAVCSFCGETKKCETQTVLGEEINICDDCKSFFGG
jgi:hypothetical protein